jgi:dihydroneopterin aldolase
MDTVFIQGLKVEAIIGAHNWEQRVPRVLVLDLELATNARLSAATDQLADALDYSTVTRRVKEVSAASRFRLIESLAEKLARMLIEEFSVQWLRITVHKPGAVPATDSVGVRIERRPSDYAN